MISDQEQFVPELWMQMEAMMSVIGGREAYENLATKLSNCNGRRRERVVSMQDVGMTILNAWNNPENFSTWPRSHEAIHSSALKYWRGHMPMATICVAIRLGDYVAIDVAEVDATKKNLIVSAWPTLAPWPTGKDDFDMASFAIRAAKWAEDKLSEVL